MSIPNAFVGKWCITEMDLWDQDFVDLVAPGRFEFRKNGTGTFRFGAVDGAVDCRSVPDAVPGRLDFTWEGSDECDAASGRGWVQLAGKGMQGHIFFHLGDNSGFKAKKMK